MTGPLGAEERRLVRAAAEAGDCNVVFPPCGDNRIGTLLSELRAYSTKGEVAFIDYLSLLNMPRSSELSEARAIGVGLVNPLKALARETGLIIVALQQLNREGQKQVTDSGKPVYPKLYHLRESGELEQAADKVALLYRYPDLGELWSDKLRQDANVPSHEERSLVRIEWAKNRNGPKRLHHFYFDAPLNRFELAKLRLRHKVNDHGSPPDTRTSRKVPGQEPLLGLQELEGPASPILQGWRRTQDASGRLGRLGCPPARWRDPMMTATLLAAGLPGPPSRSSRRG